jgi:hypothetical protein
MQYTKDQSYISDTDGRDCNDLFDRIYTIPKCKIDSDIAQIQKIIAPEKYPVDCKAHFCIMNKIFQIRLPCLKASPPHIYSNVRTHGKENNV